MVGDDNMFYPSELMNKLAQAGAQQVNDFSFVDHEGEHVEVHIVPIGRERANDNSDLL